MLPAFFLQFGAIGGHRRKGKLLMCQGFLVTKLNAHVAFFSPPVTV